MKKGIILMMSMLAFAACAPKSGAPALDLTDLDTTASPKVDFYQYATGGWQKEPASSGILPVRQFRCHP